LMRQIGASAPKKVMAKTNTSAKKI